MAEMKNDNGEELRKCGRCKSIKLLEGNFEKNAKGNIMKTCITCRNKYKCTYDECGFKSNQKDKLTRHINAVHLKIKPFECTECESKFSTPAELKGHINRHHLKLRPYECTECDSKYPVKNELKDHINRHHLKIKPFECTECESKFSTPAYLTVHINAVHLKLTPFECDKCDSKFSTKGERNRHNTICTGKERISSGEYAVKNVLIDMKIKFEHNTAFEVKYIALLRWDFICTLDTHNTRLFIEYDGRQHYEPVAFGGISQEKAEQKFINTQHRDKIKNDFCRDNNYPLLRIKYDQFGDIPKLLTEFFVKYGWGVE